MQISMTRFNLEQSPSCAKDSVALYEGGSILQDKICGSFWPPSWTSNGSEVLLIFQADGTKPSYGFTGYLSERKRRKANVKRIFLLNASILLGLSELLFLPSFISRIYDGF